MRQSRSWAAAWSLVDELGLVRQAGRAATCYAPHFSDSQPVSQLWQRPFQGPLWSRSMSGLGNNNFGLPPWLLFDEDSQKLAIWQKGRIVQGYDPREWRIDSYGSWICFSEYGQRTDYGWEKDHINPNGPDELWNLQPLYWVNNRRKSDSPPPFLGALNTYLASFNRK